jgi:hypothetical protein
MPGADEEGAQGDGGADGSTRSSLLLCGQVALRFTFLVRRGCLDGRAGYRAYRSFFRVFLEIDIILFIIISCIVTQLHDEPNEPSRS